MNLIVALVIASLVYIVQKRLYAKWWNRNLDVTISFEDTCVREGCKCPDRGYLQWEVFAFACLSCQILDQSFVPVCRYRKYSRDRQLLSKRCVLCAWLPEDHAAAAVSDWKAGTVWHTESEYDGAGFLYDNEFRI